MWGCQVGWGEDVESLPTLPTPSIASPQSAALSLSSGRNSAGLSSQHLVQVWGAEVGRFRGSRCRGISASLSLVLGTGVSGDPLP